MRKYAVIDIETTGGNSANHRITEIAIFIHDGKRITDRFESLINPQRPIPGYIQGFTGITNKMVEEAPIFEEVADRIEEITTDCVFVAHNVNFDYAFIRKEFNQIGRTFRRTKLCTVRLSRSILPNLPSYGLGSLCESLGIPIRDRHRAAGDGQATAILFGMLLEKDHEGHIEKAIKRGSKEAVLPPNLPREQYDELPAKTGVYYFYDRHGDLLYVGKARDIRSRVTSHFQGTTNTRSRQLFMERIWAVDYEICGNELIALLHESAEIRKHWPPMNRAQKHPYFRYGLFQYTDQAGYTRLNLSRVNRKNNPLISFFSLSEGRQWLSAKVREFELCPKYTGLQQTLNSCHDHQAGICRGACAFEEDTINYNSKVTEMLESINQEEETFALIGRGRTANESSVVLVDKGCYRGYGYIERDFAITDGEMLADFIKPAEDTPDARSILQSFMVRDPDLQVVALT